MAFLLTFIVVVGGVLWHIYPNVAERYSLENKENKTKKQNEKGD